MLWVLLVLGAPATVWSQSPVLGPAPTMETSRLWQTWHVIGRVTDLKGEPIRGASVRVDPGTGLRFVRKLTTDVQGRFATEYTNDLTSMPSFSVNILAEREGFYPARQFVDFGVSDKTWQIDVMMRPDTDSEDNEIPIESLTSAFAPRSRASLENNAAIAPVKKDFDRGVEAFLDNHDPAKAVPTFSKVVKRYPDCGQCRTLLGLAMLEAGDWRAQHRSLCRPINCPAERGGRRQP